MEGNNDSTHPHYTRSKKQRASTPIPTTPEKASGVDEYDWTWPDFDDAGEDKSGTCLLLMLYPVLDTFLGSIYVISDSETSSPKASLPGSSTSATMGRKKATDGLKSPSVSTVDLEQECKALEDELVSAKKICHGFTSPPPTAFNPWAHDGFY